MYRVLNYKEKAIRQRAFIYWFFTIAYMGIIFYFSSFQMPDFPAPQNFDKVLHIVAYAILAILYYLSFRKSGVNRWVFILSFLLTATYGITDEIHQLFVPGRDATLGDVLADSFGAILGSYLANMVSDRR